MLVGTELQLAPRMQLLARTGLAGGLGLPLELGAWQPARQLGGVRHRKGDAQGDAHLLGGAVVAEARGVLVAWPVVAVAVVLVLLVLAPRLGAVHEVDARLERERGDAGAREGEVVGPVEGAPHVGQVTHGQRLGARGSPERVAQRRALDDERVDVAGVAPHVGDVNVQDGGGSLERDERRLHVRLATEEAAFLRRRGDEEDGAAGGWRDLYAGFRRRPGGGPTRGAILPPLVDRDALHSPARVP